MLYKKNDLLKLTIEGMTHDGNGVGKADGFAVFVPYTAVGDEITARLLKVNKTYAFGRLEKLINPSENRIQNDCPAFQKCGGCTYRHISYEEELNIKKEKVKNAFSKIAGKEPDVLPVIPSKNIYHYRNKAQYPIGLNVQRVITVGFYSPRSHQIIAIENCLIQNPIFSEIVAAFEEFIDKNNITVYDEIRHRGLVRNIYLRIGEQSGEIMLCLVINGDSLPKSELLIGIIKQKFPNIKSLVLNINKVKTNVILGERCITLYGKDKIEDTLDGLKFYISPLSFYQVNPKQTEMLYHKALELCDLKGTETVLDLYCGIGTISLFLARKAKMVYGAEIIEEAVEDAKENAKINNVKNAEFICGDAEEAAAIFEEKGIKPDIIVVDPPRKGCSEELLNIIAKMQPQKIVYISCDPATLARDVKILTELGYQTKEAYPVDMFPRTPHVEVVTALTHSTMKK
jgi:23S rRNA (uracil1939-C5)-methyltransferase